MPTNKLIAAANQLSVILHREVITQLIAAGKDASGTLIESVQLEVDTFVDKIVITESHEFYGEWVDKGIRPSGASSRPKRKRVKGERLPKTQFLLALEEWIRIRRFSIAVNKVAGIAWVIRKNIFEFGVPATNFIQKTLDESSQKITKIIFDAAEEQINVLLINLVNKTQQSFKV